MTTPDGLPIWGIQKNSAVDPHPEFTKAAIAWISSLGVDPSRLGNTAAVTPWRGGYELHVDEIPSYDSPKSPTGKFDRTDPFDHRTVLTVRRIIPVEEDSWPAMPEAAKTAEWRGKSEMLAV